MKLFSMKPVESEERSYSRGQRVSIAEEPLHPILVHARDLLASGFKDQAAVLGRIVLDDALRRLAKGDGFGEGQATSAINDEFKKKGTYPQPQWQLVQVWLDLGDAAAHGAFHAYGTEEVEKLLDGVEAFVARMFPDQRAVSVLRSRIRREALRGLSAPPSRNARRGR